VETLLDKARFADYARDASIPIPPTVVVREPGALVSAARELGFPVIVKPALKTAAWLRASRTKAFRLDRPGAARRLAAQLAPVGVPLVVQEWVSGGDDALVTVNAYLDRTGRPSVLMTTRKVRQWPPIAGTASLAVETDDPEAVALALDVFEGVDFRGLAYLEAKRTTPGGRLVVIEANVGRPTGRAAMAEAAGHELLLTVHRDAQGRPLPAGGARPRSPGVRWIYWRHDLQASLRLLARRELGLREWWRSIGGSPVEAVFDLRDPLPFLGDVAQVLVRGVSRAMQGLRYRPPIALPWRASSREDRSRSA
jgi:predicted ATP-grasp superfamily ATP-dependent carboligase